MKNEPSSFRILLLTLLALGIFLNPLDAQKPQKQMWYQWDEVVYPAKVKEYVDATKAVIEFLKEQEYPLPMNVFSSDDFHFYFNTPISSYAAIDTLDMIWGKIFEKAGEETMGALMEAFKGTMESSLNRIYTHRPDLSYVAETDHLEDKDANFLQLYVSYPMYGMGMEFEKVCKKFVELYGSKNIDASFDVFQVQEGEERPCYFFVMWGENTAAYYAKNMELWSILEEEASELQQEMFSLLRKVDVKHMWFRKDLSYIPGE
jgi:hypothetical protein